MRELELETKSLPSILLHQVFSCSEKGQGSWGRMTSLFLLRERGNRLDLKHILWPSPLGGQQPYSHRLAPKPRDNLAHPSLASGLTSPNPTRNCFSRFHRP